MPDTRPAPAPIAAERAGSLAPHRTLLARIVIVVLLLVALMSALLFAAMDQLVRRQLVALQQTQLERQTRELATFLDNEKGHFRRLAEFIAADSDLVHATQYHVVLRGEDKALRADVGRLAATFQLDLVALRVGRQPPLVAAGRHASLVAELDALQPGAADTAAAVDALWARDAVWLVAAAPLRVPGHDPVRLWIARPLSGLFSTVAPPAVPPQALRADASETPNGMRLLVKDVRGQPLTLHIPAHDAAQETLRTTSRVLAVLLAATGVLLAVALALFLRRELAAVKALTGAAAAVGRGDFEHVVPVSGQGEVAQLARVFNRMVLDLKRLHALESSAHHKEQLAGIGRLATRVAHDINNPLTVIRNSVRLTQRRADLPSGLVDELALIGHSCERCIGIVEALLRFGRPMRLRHTRFDLADLVRASVERVGQQRGDGRLAFVPPAAPVAFDGDAFQVEQLLVNLLANAYDAAPNGAITVEVVADEAQAEIRVQDQGPGFSAVALEHLAEPFFTSKAQGTGLGLASCMAIARAHGGTLRVDNRDGARVTVLLPLDAGLHPQAAS